MIGNWWSDWKKLVERLEIVRVINIMSGIFLQMIGDEWLGIETGWEEVKSKELFLQLLMLANLN